MKRLACEVFAGTVRLLVSAAAVSFWFALPAHAQVDPRKCSAPAVMADERLAACTATIEAAAGDWRSLAAAYGVRARVYLAKREFDHAIADYSQIIKYDPQNRYAYIHRGEAYLYNNDFDHAIADLAEAIRIDPTDEAAYVDRAVAYHRSGQVSSAMADYHRAIELNPNSPLVYQSRGAVYLREEDHDRAIDDFSQAIKLNPRFEPAYLWRARTYLAKGEPDRALADLDKAVRLYPRDRNALINRSNARAAKGDLEGAMADCERIVELNPQDAGGYRACAMVLWQGGALSKSLTDLDEAARLDPKSAYVALWREIVATRSGQPSQLVEAANQLDMTKWPAPIVKLFLGALTPEQVLSAADDPDQRKKKGQVCEANFYTAEFGLQRGSKEDARRLLEQAEADCPKIFVESRAASVELKALSGEH